jgi:ATP synthase protein I
MAEDENGEVPKLPPDARLESLDQRLDRMQQAEAKRTGRAQGDRTGWLVVNQLIGGPLGGGIVGWLLDRWLGTAPWLMLTLMFVGFAGGVFNIFRVSSNRAGADRRDG